MQLKLLVIGIVSLLTLNSASSIEDGASGVVGPAELWGQRGSNPRPMDYESTALTD